MKTRPQIAIVGAGPGGLTAAIILKNYGFPVQVFEQEQSPDQRTQGGSLDLHDDGGQLALQRAGLLDAFRAIARHEDQEGRNVDPRSGRPMEMVQPDEDNDRPEIDRGVLRDLLLSALPLSVVNWDRRLENIERSHDGHWRLSFENGDDIAADIVIGADGAWSRVRRALTRISPEYSGVTFVEGWLETPSAEQADFVGHGTLFSFGGAEAIFAQRNGEGRICVYAALRRSREWIASEVERQSLRGLVLATYEGWAAPLRDLVNGCTGFVERPIYQLPTGFEWAPQHGLYLLGDAAHLMPPVGVGVNLAMLDASDLALAIANASEWQSAAADMQTEIHHRASKIMQEAIPGFQQWFSDAGTDVQIRNG